MIISSSSRRPSQRGTAALLTVMVLVLVMSVTFAFANRSLIFEQRTAANQLRSTQALEIADAGLEWTLAMLNHKYSVTSTCASPGASSDTTYSLRHLSINSQTGVIASKGVRSACVIGNNGTTPTLNCACPVSGDPAPSGSGAHFSIEFTAFTLRPDLVRVTSRGCTATEAAGTFDSRCMANGSTNASDGAATVSAVFAQIPAVFPSPKAALTARGDVNWQGAGASLYVANTDAATNGITINAGGTVVTDAHVNLVSAPGTPQGSDTGLSVVDGDSTLATMDGDRYFTSLMGTTKADFYNNELTLKLTSVSQLDSITENDRMVWLGPPPGQAPGTFEITGGTFGTLQKPIVFVVNGNVSIRGNTTINGVFYSTAATLDNTGGGNSFLRGAVISEGDYTSSNGSREVVYDSDILTRLWKDTSLSRFVRVPGSWTD